MVKHCWLQATDRKNELSAPERKLIPQLSKWLDIINAQESKVSTKEKEKQEKIGRFEGAQINKSGLTLSEDQPTFLPKVAEARTVKPERTSYPSRLKISYIQNKIKTAHRLTNLRLIQRTADSVTMYRLEIIYYKTPNKARDKIRQQKRQKMK